MKKKIALLFALLLTASATLVACGDKCDPHVDEDRDELCDVCGETVTYDRTYLNFEGLYNPDYAPELPETIDFGKAKNNSDLENLTFTEFSQVRLAAFTNYEAKADEVKYAVLNVETAEVVLSLKMEAEDALVTSHAQFIQVGDEDFILVVETNRTHEALGLIEHTAELYTADGKKVTSKNAPYISVEHQYGNIYVIDDKIYEIEDGVFNYVDDKGFIDFPNVDISTETHHYDFLYDGVRVYDLEYKLVACYMAPAGTEANVHILADGNLFIQLYRELPWDAEKYDLYVDDVKLDVRSLIFNITENKATTVQFDYFVDEIFNVHTDTPFDGAEFEDVAAEGVLTNIVLFYDAVSKVPNANDPLVADFDNEMKLKGYLGGQIDNQYGIAEPIGGERYIVTDKGGNRYLLNEKGEVIGALGDAVYDASLGLFLLGNKYYDLDLKQEYDANEIDYQYLYVDGNGDFSIYAKNKGFEIQYYLRHGYEMTELELPKNVSRIEVSDSYFTYNYYTETENKEGVVERRDFVVCCNRMGEKIYSIETSAEAYAGHEFIPMGDVLIIQQSVLTRIAGTNGQPDTFTITTRNYISK